MSDCINKPDGLLCPSPSTWNNCRPWDLTQQSRTNCYMDGLSQEALSIAGARINVHKLLGVQEQTKLLDLTGTGIAISGGDAENYPASNAFTTTRREWRSKHVGSAAILASSYVGYDFGVVKLPNGRQRYGIEANVRQHITTIRIKQSNTPSMRVTKARIERSDDGHGWYGVAILELPDNNTLNTISFKQSVPSRYWRLRPLAFTGDVCDSWGIQAFEMHDYATTSIDNIQDAILMENRDRDYDQSAILLKGYYDIQQAMVDLSVFGAMIPVKYNIKVNFNQTVATLGRSIVVGDIIELPSETQYTPDLKPVKRYLEVTDVSWDSSSYTPGWLPLMLLIFAEPALASQETRGIFGDLASHVDSSGLFDNDDGNAQKYQDFSNIDQTIRTEANTQVHERGSEGSNVIREFTEAELAADALKFPHLNRVGFNRTGLYVEDALPQNNAPYTEGPDFPSTPKDGDYHRMTYAGLARDIPARLYRYSGTKARWIYLETDKREQYNNQKAILEEYTMSSTKIPAKEIR